MSVTSALRVATVGVFHLSTRPCSSQIISSALRSASQLTCGQGRLFHASSLRRAWIKNAQSHKPQETKEERKARERKLKEIGLRDGDIPYKRVQVTSPEGLSGFRLLSDVVSEVDHLNALDPDSRKRYHAQLIVNDPSPIVKIIDFKKEFQKKKEAQERAKGNAAQKVRKEVQLTWHSSEVDVQTKLGKAKEDLEKGYKVDLAIMPKKGIRAPPPEDMRRRAEEFAEHFSEIAKEWKARDFARAAAVIYLQGTATSSAVVKEQETGGVPKKVLVREQRRQKEAERLRRRKQEQDELESTYSESTGMGLLS